MTKLSNPAVAVPLKSLPAGEYFKRKVDAKQVYIKGGYDGGGDWWAQKADDIGAGMLLKGKTLVFAGFTY
jgi:hypothetical protein